MDTSHFCIKPSYQARTQYQHHDDSSLKDEWQLEVYLHALGLMKKYNFKRVIDLGCGSAYKLMTYLREYETIGLELPINVEILEKRYPYRKWLVSDFSKPLRLMTDVVICADVVEHLVNPDELMDYLKNISFKYLIFSTPDRNLMYRPGEPGFDGPPRNFAHMREWNSKEFRNYISLHFNLLEHKITNLRQGTQMIVCQAK